MAPRSYYPEAGAFAAYNMVAERLRLKVVIGCTNCYRRRKLIIG
jgi:hypothetical protein